MKKIIKKDNFYILCTVFIFTLFLLITKWTPLAGDDWGYALNGLKGNPIKMAVSFYYSWSGRFFSELWGFVIAPRKILWNIINPILFALIFVLVYKLAFRGKNPVISALLIVAMMLSVDDHLRMETYSWIMGTTYVIPLLFSLFFFYIAKLMIFNNTPKTSIIFNYLSNITLFIGGMMMENISACMVGGICIIIIYCYFTDRKHLIKYFVINLIVSLLALVLMRSAPGSAFRLERDSAEWIATPLVERIINSYPNFLEKTFINNNYMILFLSLVLSLLCLKKFNIKNFLSILINVLAVFSVFSFVLIKVNNPFVMGNSIVSMIFWPIYVVNVFVTIYNNINNIECKSLALFVLVIAGANALAMLFSPIYGARSAIYTVYYVIALSVILISEIELNKIEKIIFALALIFVTLDRTKEFITKYRLVAETNQKRMEIIEYYKQHPEDEDVWIPRFGIYTIHSADIEIGDTYHFETFKNYYGLPQDADNIHFYYEEK